VPLSLFPGQEAAGEEIRRHCQWRQQYLVGSAAVLAAAEEKLPQRHHCQEEGRMMPQQL